jgi:hypothetical protein
MALGDTSNGRYAMPVELREITIHATRPHDPVGYVQFFAGDGADLEQSEQWITGQVPAGMPAMKSVALLQIVALQRARSLLDDEIERLIRLYEAAEQSQR